jgi:hypothetical protein
MTISFAGDAETGRSLAIPEMALCRRNSSDAVFSKCLLSPDDSLCQYAQAFFK